MQKKKSQHDVFHEFSDRGTHFYTVYSPSGEEHNVSVSVSCDDRFMSVQGIAKGKICSHIVAVLDQMAQDMNSNSISKEDMKTIKRNRCLQLIKPSNRKLNEIRVSSGEGKAHQDTKIGICQQLKAQGKHFVTEAIFNTGGRADIVVLDDFRVIEILNSEKKENLASKKEEYPKNITLDYIKI